MTLLGWKATARRTLAPRHGEIKLSRKNRKGRGLKLEGLEQRQLLAADISVVDLITADDTGSDQFDNITNKPLPQIDVQFSNLNTVAAETIEVRDNATNTLLGVATPAVSSGTVTITLTTPLAEGSNTIRAQGGFGGGVTRTLGIDLDTNPPASPTVDSVSNDVGGGLTPDNMPTLGGTGEPGSTVEVFVDAASEGTVVVPASGSWSLTVSSTLADGPHSVTATQEDVAGNTSGSSSSFDIEVDTTPPAAPVAPFTIATDTNISGDGVTADNMPTVSGPAGSVDANTQVTVSVINTTTMVETVIGTAVADGTGAFDTATYTAGSALADGVYDVKVTSADGVGNTASTTDLAVLTVDTVKPSVAALVSSDTQITESDAGLTVSLTIDFSEPMDPSSPLTVSSSNAATTFTAPVVTNVDADTFQVDFTIFDASVEVADVKFNIAGARDIAGNVMNPVLLSTSPTTSVDTLVPVASVAFNDSPPQEEDSTAVNAQVTFSLDSPSTGTTTIFYMVGGAGDTATAGVDYQVPDATAFNPGPPGTGNYMGSVVIGPGGSQVLLDIDVLGDFILEGDETLSVKITNVTNATEAVGWSTNPATVTIEDNEIGAILTLGTSDMNASEGTFNFPPVDLTGASVLNADIIANDANGAAVSGSDTVQDLFEPGTGNDQVYTTESNDANFGTGNGPNLPDDGDFGALAGVHPAVQLAYKNADDGDNARLTPAAASVQDVFNIDVFNKSYEAIHLFGASTLGTSKVSVRFFYADSTVDAAPSKDFGDWRLAPTADTYALFDGGDTTDAANSALDSADAIGIFGAVYTPNPNKVLNYIEVSVDTSGLAAGGNFAFLGASGVAVGNNMGVYNLDLTGALTDPLTVDLEITGEAIPGVDYDLTTPTPGASVALVVVSGKTRARVTIPANASGVEIKLTPIDDMIVEGGLTNSPGIEDAILKILPATLSGAQANLVSVGTPDSGTVKIEDNDFGKLSIEGVADTTEGDDYPDSGKFVVSLDKANTTSTGSAMSSRDIIATVDIAGDADIGDDYQVSIRSEAKTSQSTAQRIDGFWSLQADPDISNATTWAHNTVRYLGTDNVPSVGGKHYYEIVLFTSGRVNIDIDGTNGFNSHLRLLDSDGNAIAGDNNASTGTGAGGSTSSKDAFIAGPTLAAGRYIIEVSAHNSGQPDDDSGATNSNRTANMSASDEYTLNVSIENHDEGVLIPAGAEMTMFNIDPIDDKVVEGGPTNSLGFEDVKFTLTGFAYSDPDISIMAGMDSDDVDIFDNDSATVQVATDFGHEDPLPTPPSNDTKDGTFKLSLSGGQTSSSATVIKFKINGFTENPPNVPVVGTPKVGNDAVFGEDYTLSSSNGTLSFDPMTGMGFITIPAGANSATVIVDVINEDVIEDDEEVRFEVLSTDYMGDADITLPTGTEYSVDIFDEDKSDVAINGTAFAREGGQTGVFTVSLDNPKVSDTHTDVEFMVVPATTTPAAIAPLNPPNAPSTWDYSVTGPNVLSYNPATGKGVVRIPAFSQTGDIQITATVDAILESTEFAKVMLLGIVPGAADANITGIDPVFTMSEIEIRDGNKAWVKIEATANGMEPSTPGEFTFSLRDAATGGGLLTTSIPVTVTYATLASSTATAGPAGDGFNIDYKTLPGTVTITPGNNSVVVPVSVFDDVVNESNETVNVQITGTNNLTQFPIHSMNQDTVIIQDNDAVQVRITADDSMAREGNSVVGMNDNGRYRIELVSPGTNTPVFSDSPVVVDLAVLTGNGPNADATETSDYSLSSKSVTFAPFQTMSFVDLNVINDGVLEEYIEQAEVKVSALVSANTGVNVSSNSAIVDIKPDPTLRVSVVDAMGMETMPAGGDNAIFRVSMPIISGGPMNGAVLKADSDLTITYMLGGDAVNGEDFTLSGTAVIPQADGFVNIVVPVLDDMKIEDLELLSLTLMTVDGADPKDDDIGIAKDLYSVSPDDANLRIINARPETPLASRGGTLATIAMTTPGDTILRGYGLAVDPVSGELYAVLETSSISRALATVDPATGVATIKGDLDDSSVSGTEDFRGISFNAAGVLTGVRNDGKLYTINKTNANITAAGSVGTTSGTEGLGYNPVDDRTYQVSGNGNPSQFNRVGGGTVAVTTTPGVTNAGALEHLELGNFGLQSGSFNSFFLAEANGSGSKLFTATFDASTPALDAAVTSYGTLNHGVEGLAFVKSNAFVSIKDNDTGFLDVVAKPKGFDNLNDDVDTGFTITLVKPDGTTPTQSDSDTTVSFTTMASATPFLGTQASTNAGSIGTAQNIDTFASLPLGGAHNWKPNGAGVPHTLVEATTVSASKEYYKFTVLNDGDAVQASVNKPGTLKLFKSTGGTALASGGTINTTLPAGTYVIEVDVNVVSPSASNEKYVLDVAVENHLIADYELTSDAANDLTFVSPGNWEVTIPMMQESIMVTVDVFNDTQVEGDENVSLWLKSVVAGDADIYTGLVYFADNNDASDDGIGRVDVGGNGLVKLINTDAFMPSDSNPFGVSIDAAEGKIYWSDNSTTGEGIFRANLDGSGVALIVGTSGVSDPQGIQVVGDKLYWVDSNTTELHRINKDGSGSIEDLVDITGISDLSDVAVDQVNGKIYWVDATTQRISRSNLNGGGIETLIQFSASSPGAAEAIALDVAGGKMYWTDSGTDSIRRANLDGTSVQTVASALSAFPEGIALDLVNKFVYWVDSDGANNIYRADLNGSLPASAELVSDPNALPGTQNLNHLDLLIPGRLHATAEICDTDTAEVFVSSDNTLAEASVSPASEAPIHKDIVISLRDANGNPATVQTSTTVNYTYSADSTATNGLDHALLSGTSLIPAGQTSAPLRNTTPPPPPSVFVFNDSLLEGDETVIVGLNSATGGPAVTVVPATQEENKGFVLIKDNESATVSITANDDIAKERSGVVSNPSEPTDEPLDPGQFTIALSKPSSTDTIVEFMLDTPTTAESSDYNLSAKPANMLTDLGGGMWSIKVLANEFTATVDVNVVEDPVVEPDEVLALKLVSVSSASGADITLSTTPGALSDSVTIYDDDIAKVVITNNGNAVESTQPATSPNPSPGTSGQFKIALVDPATGSTFIESETPTTVKVLLDESIADVAVFSTTPGVTNSGDYNIPEIVTPSNYPASPRFALVTFAPGETMKFLNVNLVKETPPLDMGDEFVKLTLDPTYGIPTDSRVDDGVVGDAQILLDKMPGGLVSGDNPDVIFTIDVSGSTSSAFGGTPVGDVNGDGSSNTILDAQLDALIKLNDSFIVAGQVNRVSIVIFGSNAAAVDLSIATGLQDGVSPDADSNGNSIPDIAEVLQLITIGGGGAGLSGGGMSIPSVGSWNQLYGRREFSSSGAFVAGNHAGKWQCCVPVGRQWIVEFSRCGCVAGSGR